MRIYKNLHQNCFSIMDYKSRLVVAYAEEVTISNVSFFISQKGQQRARMKQVRNVHAFAVGLFVAAETMLNVSDLDEVFYNPFQTDFFINRATQKRVAHAEKVHCQSGRCFLI